MRTPTRSVRALLAAFAALGAFASLSTAQSVATDPVGAVTIALPAGPSTSMIGLPIKSTSVYNGKVASVGATGLTFSGTPFAATNLSATGAPFFVRILSGAQQGRALLITSNTDSSVTVDATDGQTNPVNLDTVDFAVAVDDLVEIVPGDTLATLFGTGTDLTLVGGTSVFAADTVSFWNGARFVAHYYNTTLGHWVSQENTSNANNRLIRPEEGVSVSRKSGRPAISLTFIGNVPKETVLYKHDGQSTRVLVQPLPIPVTLGDLDFSANGGLVAGTSTFNADTVSLWNGARWVSYFKHTDGRWLTSGSAVDQAGLVVNPGQGLSIFRRTAKTGANSLLGMNTTYTF